MKTLILADDEIDDRIRTSTPGRWRWVGWMVLTPFLVYGGLLLLFVIKPFTHVESLRHPLAVAAIKDDSLILEDGSRKTLALVNRLPKDDPIFLAAIKNGVEIDRDGNAFGLLTIYPSCGMTFERYSTIRVDLRDLAVALDPTRLDESVVSPEMIQYFK